MTQKAPYYHFCPYLQMRLFRGKFAGGLGAGAVRERDVRRLVPGIIRVAGDLDPDVGALRELFEIGRGLLKAAAVVAGDVSILDSSRRNRNFKVIRDGSPGLFIKQMREMQPDAMLTLKRESAGYEVARDDPALSRLMPRLVAYDGNRHVLIVELLPDAESLAEYHAREKMFPTEIGRMLGEGLGLYHAHAGVLLNNQKLQALFPGKCR